MTINRKGTTRIVFEFDKTVVKIPNFLGSWSRFLRGILANIHEQQTWKWNSGKYESGFSHLLCPVLWCSWGGWVLVMKKARTFSWEEWEKMEYFIDQHRAHFSGDDSVSNYGVLDNRLVKIDYGQLNNNKYETNNCLKANAKE